MKKRWLTIFCTALFAMLIMTATDTKAADETSAWEQGKEEIQTEGAFTYHIHPSQNGEEAWIYKIEIQGKSSKTLSIPETILGKKVTRLGCPEHGSEEDELDEAYATLFGTYIEPWHNRDGSNKEVSSLKSIQIPDTVEVIDRAAFSGLSSITKMKLPKKIKKIEQYTFYGCDKLKTIVLPEQLESFENSSLWGCPSLKKIELSKKNKIFQVKGNCLIRKKNKALIFAATGGKKFNIPSGIKRITSYAFGSTKSPVIHIPASVSKIEKAAFHKNSWQENTKIKDVTISRNNPVFARDGQCIYKKSDKSLVIVIADKKGVLRISERVEKLTSNISLVNCDSTAAEFMEGHLEKIIYPSSLKHVSASGFDAIDVYHVYFTGSVPPKVSKSKSSDVASLPTNCHVYVPKAYEKVYKAWYKKNKCYTHIDGWHTYNP